MARYLLEVYVGACEGAGTDRLAAAGTPVSLLSAIYVPEDETCFYLYEADSADDVRELARRAHIDNARVVAAITDTEGARR
jgi:hypothetical protein